MSEPHSQNWANWSGHQKSSPAQIFRPADESELQAAIAGLPAPVRPVGSGHSFSPLVPSDGTIVDIAALSGVVKAEGTRVTVQAGSHLRALGADLRARGLAFKNQGDIDHQTVAGVVSTGTHGTGLHAGSFSDFVTHIRMVLANGTLWESDANTLDAARVSMGLLGVMSEIILEVCPAYDLAEESRAMSLEDALAEVHSGQHLHAELFWFFHDNRCILKTLNPVTAAHEGWPEAVPLPEIDDPTSEDAMFEAAATTLRFFPQATATLHAALMDGITAEHRRGPSNLIFPSPRNARFNEMEYAVPLTDGPAALRAVGEALRQSGVGCMWPVEYRTVPASTGWLSPAFARDSVTISVHQYAPVNPWKLFAVAEAVLRGFDGRPHPGKMHSLKAADMRSLYPRFDDFAALRQKLDPNGTLLTPFLRDIYHS